MAVCLASGLGLLEKALPLAKFYIRIICYIKLAFLYYRHEIRIVIKCQRIA